MSDVPRAALAELVGTFVFLTIGAGSIVLASSGVAGGQLDLLGIAAANGIALAVMVTVFGGISGGHFNPAVTVSVFLGGRIEPLRASAYVVAQLVGAVCAGYILKIMFLPAEWGFSNVGTPTIAPTVSVGRAILIEAVLTFVLVLAVWGTGTDPRGANVGGFAIGLALFVDMLVGGPLTGAAMNPARHFGTALASGVFGDWWVYWVGPLLGGAVAGLLFSGVFLADEPEEAMPAVAAGATQPQEEGPDAG